MKDKKNMMIDQDFTEAMASGEWVRMSELFELKPKNKTITLRVNSELFEGIKKIAKEKKVSYQKLIRSKISELIEEAS